MVTLGTCRTHNVDSRTRCPIPNAHKKVRWHQRTRISNCVRKRHCRTCVGVWSSEEGKKASLLWNLGSYPGDSLSCPYVGLQAVATTHLS
jgi:hypothetical protein